MGEKGRQTIAVQLDLTRVLFPRDGKQGGKKGREQTSIDPRKMTEEFFNRVGRQIDMIVIQNE